MSIIQRNMEATKKIVDFHNSLSGDQMFMMSEHLPVLQLLSRMTEKEWIFTETFLVKIFGGCAV